MATRIFVADAMSYRTAGLMDDATAALDPAAPDHDQHVVGVLEEYTIECSIIKVFGTEALDFVADESLQMLGGYGFIAEYPVERHYRDSRINRIFEGTNEINRLIIPATLLKRAGKGALPYFDFLQTVQREVADPTTRPAPTSGPLALETQAVEMAKRVVAYTVQVMLQRDLASLQEKQQHLLILADMIIDVYAMESVTARVQDQLVLHPGGGPSDRVRDDLRLRRLRKPTRGRGPPPLLPNRRRRRSPPPAPCARSRPSSRFARSMRKRGSPSG